MSALWSTQNVGNSMIVLIPCERAHLARIHLLNSAGSPRWTKDPLITPTIGAWGYCFFMF